MYLQYMKHHETHQNILCIRILVWFFVSEIHCIHGVDFDCQVTKRSSTASVECCRVQPASTGFNWKGFHWVSRFQTCQGLTRATQRLDMDYVNSFDAFGRR